MPQAEASLWRLIASGGGLADRFLHGVECSVALDALAAGSSLSCPPEELAGRAVLVATSDQLPAALAAIELDGVARRIVLCPPDAAAEHLAHVLATAEIEAVVSDGTVPAAAIGPDPRLVEGGAKIAPVTRAPLPYRQTEWVLLTSGTTGAPKLVVHTLASLAGAIKPNSDTPTERAVWSTFYDIRRYGGLQIFLRAILGGGSMVLSSAREGVADFLARAAHHGVTNISGTPSHWRRALMSPAAARIAPQYVRLSGEIADQAILDDLRKFYPAAGVGHAFATTEAGVGFAVNDGLAGFPASLVGQPGAEVEIKIVDGSLRIRSPRTATRYLGAGAASLRDPDGFVDTGDMLELRDGRYYFMGRRGGVINVGGLKVHPEEVEAVINRHPAVEMSLVKARKNSFTGAVVVAEVVPRPGSCDPQDERSAAGLKGEIIEACRRSLAPYKVPAAVRIVAALDIGAAGKLARPGA